MELHIFITIYVQYYFNCSDQRQRGGDYGQEILRTGEKK